MTSAGTTCPRGGSWAVGLLRYSQALDALDGVEEVVPSLADKTVRVRHDPARVSAGQLASVLTEGGYPAAARAA